MYETAGRIKVPRRPNNLFFPGSLGRGGGSKRTTTATTTGAAAARKFRTEYRSVKLTAQKRLISLRKYRMLTLNFYSDNAIPTSRISRSVCLIFVFIFGTRREPVRVNLKT